MASNDRPLILVVEDDVKIANLVCRYLQASDFDVEHLDEGHAVVPFVTKRGPAAILLDIRLPGRNGMDLCRDIRAFSSVPIIMLTAMVEEIDRLLGLEVGADDYICKPFSPREVVARVKALLRRVALDTAPSFDRRGPFAIDEATMRIKIDDVALDLTRTEFRLLATLLAHPGHVYSRAQLLDAAYSEPEAAVDRVIDSHIKNIRKKIANAFPSGTKAPDYLRSVYGVGYKIEC